MAGTPIATRARAAKQLRDLSGKFTTPHAKLRAQRFHAQFEREVRSMEHAEGKAYVPAFFNHLPGMATKVRAVETVAPVDETVDPMPLFHQRAA